MTPFAIKLIGHSCEVAGGILFAYEVLLGYPNRNKREVAERKRDNTTRFLDDALKRIEDLKATYPNPEGAKAELKAKWQPEIDKLQIEIDKHGNRYELVSFLLGWLGAIVLLVGFGMQIIAELIEKNAH